MRDWKILVIAKYIGPQIRFSALDGVKAFSLRCAILCITGTILAGCASGPSDVTLGDQDLRTHDVVLQAMGLLENRYIDPLSPEQLTVNALDGLSAIDPAISAVITPDTIITQCHRATVREMALPAAAELTHFEDQNETWAGLVLRGLVDLRAHSAALRRADNQTIQTALLKGAIAGLDRYSRYEAPRQAETTRTRREGYIGVGIEVIGGEGYPVVREILDGSPAGKSGVRPGDQIVSVDGVDQYNHQTDDTTRMLHGQIGTTTAIEYNPSGTNDIVKTVLTRERVIERTVFSRFQHNILILRVTSFNSDTGSELAKALERARDGNPGKDLHGVVLDLRGNRGGLLNQGVAVADAFLAGGPIGKTHARISAARHTFDADNHDLAGGLPLVVLIDGRTASSAELVAAALQDRGRALLVGTTSFGKGSVQAINDLINHGTLTFTWSRMTAPSGYIFDRIGLHPAICTSLNPGLSATAMIADAIKRKDKLRALMVAWRETGFQDQSKRQALRATCPTDTTKRKIDVDVAEKLIENAVDYQALHHIPQLEIADTRILQ